MICSFCGKTKPPDAIAIKGIGHKSNIFMIGGVRHDFTAKIVCVECYNRFRAAAGVQTL